MLDNIAAGMADDEIDYLIKKVGIARVKTALTKVLNEDEASANAREKMPASFDINGITYWRQS